MENKNGNKNCGKTNIEKNNVGQIIHHVPAPLTAAVAATSAPWASMFSN
jgi:hypothetical protein